MRLRHVNESGQLMMMAVGIMVVLGICVAAIIFLNQTASKHMMMSHYRQKSQTSAEAGLSYAMNRLTNPAVWNNALVNNTFDADFDGTVLSTGPGGSRFTIACSRTGANLTAYQVRIKVVGYTGVETPTATPLRAIEAIVSQKSIGASLSTGLRGSAALVLQSTPSVLGSGSLVVNWGPIVEYDASTWTLTGVLDSGQYPRKFSVGGITGTYFARATSVNGILSDQKEYWAYSSLGFPTQVDVNKYSNLSQLAGGVPPPAGQSSVNTVTCSPAGSGFCVGVASFTATAYTVTQSTTVIFLDGDSVWENSSFDFKKDATSGGAFVTTGNLILGNNTGANRFVPPLYRVPSTANLEYPYWVSGGGGNPPTWPCQNLAGGTCTSTQAGTAGGVDFRGFLYVQKDLTVLANQNWVIIGAVMVDGVLTIQPGGSLTIYYDDEINHQINMSTFQLQVDSVRTIPVS